MLAVIGGNIDHVRGRCKSFGSFCNSQKQNAAGSIDLKPPVPVQVAGQFRFDIVGMDDLDDFFRVLDHVAVGTCRSSHVHAGIRRQYLPVCRVIITSGRDTVQIDLDLIFFRKLIVFSQRDR